MLEEKVENNFREQFETLLPSGNSAQLCEFLDDQNISDVAELIYEYPEHEALIISCMSIHRAASVFKILELSNQKNIILELPAHKTAALLNALPPDDRTDFFEELPSNVVRELIKLLNAEERKIALSLLGYPENSVGAFDDA
jgi:magnesium transporter